MEVGVKDLILAYSNGIFPMADDAIGSIVWYSPNPRAIIPIYSYKPAKSLKPVINKAEFTIKINADFEAVIKNCSLPRFDGDGKWISDQIIDLYLKMHKLGLAHSVEAYKNGQLAGGLYGVSIGSVFFGESMFHNVSNASKVAFHYLIENLRNKKFQLLDTQFINDNVKRFGAVEIPQKDFLKILKSSISIPNKFD